MSSLELHNARMLKVMEYCVSKHVVNSKRQFLLSIGFDVPGNLNQVLSAKQSFTLKQMRMAIDLYGLDANYFFKKDAKMLEQPLDKKVQTITRAGQRMTIIRTG